MTSIRVHDLVGPICVDPKDGAAICYRAHAALGDGNGIVLDFTGVRTLTSSFLNSAVACLFSAFTIDTIAQKLKWTGLDCTDEELVHLVLRNAARYYKATPSQQAVIAEVFCRATE